METKIFVELEENVDHDPMLGMAMNLALIGAGVEMRQGMVLNVSSEEVAQAVERILKAACRPHQVLRKSYQVQTGGTEEFSFSSAGEKYGLAWPQPGMTFNIHVTPSANADPHAIAKTIARELSRQISGGSSADPAPTPEGPDDNGPSPLSDYATFTITNSLFVETSADDTERGQDLSLELLISAAESKDGKNDEEAVLRLFSELARMNPLEIEKIRSEICERTNLRRRVFDGLLRAARMIESAVAVEGPADTKALEQLVGQPIAVAVSGEESAVVDQQICAECGKPFTPSGNRPQKYCADPACKKARAARYAKEAQARKKKGPDDADLREAEALVEQLRPEIEAFGPGVEEAVDQAAQADQEAAEAEKAAAEAEVIAHAEEIPTEPVIEIHEPKTEEEAGVDFRDKVWHVEDGPRAGRDFSSSQLRMMLLQGNMRVGQHLLHRRDGRHEVVKVPGQPVQKLKKCFGENAGQVVSA